MDQDYDQMDLEGNEFNFKVRAHSLLIDHVSEITTSFNVGIIRPYSILIHYTMNHVFFPMKGFISLSASKTLSSSIILNSKHK
ncbi:hypothetical protein RYX36_004412 [Vicia faba]